MTVVEPGELSQGIEESYGHPTERKREFSFTLKNTPIIPGTVQVAGQVAEGEYYAKRVYLYDDGNGNLYGNEVSWQCTNMNGTVNYTTGEVYVDFGDARIENPINNLPIPTWSDVPVLPGKDALGKDMVRATYRPVKGDRIIPQTGDTFTDTFQPNDVHIYKISTGGISSLSPFTKLWNFLKGLLTGKTGQAILTGKITGNAVNEANENGSSKALYVVLSVLAGIILIIVMIRFVRIRNRKLRSKKKR